MAGSNWQQLAGGSVNPYDVLRDDGTPTADYGQHVICDGGTVALPSPQANGAVLVSNISQNTTVTTSTGLVEQDSQVTHLSDASDPVLFVSDGSDWYVANNLDYLGGIPDSFEDQNLEWSKKKLINRYKTLSDNNHSIVDAFLLGLINGKKDSLNYVINSIKQVKREDIIKVAKQVNVTTYYLLKPGSA